MFYVLRLLREFERRAPACATDRIDAGLGTFWSWCASADVERESVLVVLGKERRPLEPLTLVPRDGGREDVEDESD